MSRGGLLISGGIAPGYPHGESMRFLRAISSFVNFCQRNGLTRRTVLKKGRRATQTTHVFRLDLTHRGYRLFKLAYLQWSQAAIKGAIEPGNTDFLGAALALIRKRKSREIPKSVPIELPQSASPQRGKSSFGKRSLARRIVSKRSRRPVLTPEEEEEFEAAGPHVYDKADWHTEGEFPSKLPAEQANVHTGMFLGWLIEHNMVYGEFRPMVRGFKRKRFTGAEYYRSLGGALQSDQLTEEGNQFARDYYERKYFKDYTELLACGLPSCYHVKDTWENYAIISKRIEQRYQEWKRLLADRRPSSKSAASSKKKKRQ